MADKPAEQAPELLRKILKGPVEDGLYTVPTEKLTVEEETEAAKRRMRWVRIADYADETCGISNTLDPEAAYLCGGREDGSSSPCNMFRGNGDNRCLILEGGPMKKPHLSSCGKWEIRNDGDPEGDSCHKGFFSAADLSFGVTKNPQGWGCVRCEYGQKFMPEPDSEGRTRFCQLANIAVGEKACCRRNEAIKIEEKEESKDKALDSVKDILGGKG
jgi:hypothetical protein